MGSPNCRETPPEKLLANGYEDCTVCDEETKNIKHQYLRKSFADAARSRISDRTQLERQVHDPDSEFWQFLKQEIEAWKKAVCGN